MSINLRSNLSLKYKLLAFIGVVVLISITTVSIVSYSKSKNALYESTQNQLISSGEAIHKSLSWFLERSKSFSNLLTKDRLIEGLFIAYESSFYGSNFNAGVDLKIDNEFYNKLDEIYGERKKNILTEFELKDILLVNLDAQVIFTANNEQNEFFLGRNLLNGKFKDSALSECYQNVIKNENQVLIFTGFNYNEVTNNVDGFICTKKFAEFANQDEGISKGDLIGIIITQIENDIITKMLTDRSGMGLTGQSYLVGDDYLLRSDFYLEADRLNAINSMKKNLSIKSEALDLAFAGKKGILQKTNANNNEVLSFYQPFNFMEKKYAIITDKTTDEIFQSITSTLIFIVSISIVLFLIVVIITLFVMNNLLAPVVKAKEFLETLASNLKDNAENLQKSSQSLSDGAEGTASSIQQVVATMNELTHMVQNNLDNVKKTNTASGEVLTSVNKGKGETAQMMNSVQDISSNNDEIVKAIVDINSDMQAFKEVIYNISDKTNMINEIVSQTKLLSFNASVEAARAGELGKGFAVVAEEVGKLATASGNAAEEIKALLDDSVNNVERMIGKSTERVDRLKVETQRKISTGKERASDCENSLSVIQDQINLVTAKISEIDTASNEQSNGLKDVSVAMKSLAETSQHTTRIASDTLTFSQDILERAVDLNQISQELDALIEGSHST